MIGIREVEYIDATLIPALRHDVASRYRNETTVMRHAVFHVRLRSKHLEVAVLRHLAVVDRENRVTTETERIRRAATRRCAASPLIREYDFRCVVVEHG